MAYEAAQSSLLRCGFIRTSIGISRRSVPVLVGLIAQAAHELATDSGYLARIQAEVLYSRTLETDRLDFLEKSVAA